MIARWMLAAMLFALLVGVAAVAAERALRALGRPTRWPWAAAIAAAMGWPVFAALRPVEPTQVAIPDAPIAALTVQPEWIAAAEAAASVVDTSGQLDKLLAALWTGASLLMLAHLVRGVRALQHARRHARVAQLHGERVLVAGSLGPAVLGVIDPRIVVPEWLLGLDPSLQSLVLRHEREHCEARDTALVWLGVSATVLMPWNLALWWMSRRLRLAMEIDCDARTLRGSPEHATYAKLLLLIAQRQTTARFVPMLAESSSHLSRRISAMRSIPVKHRVLKAALLIAVASVAVVVACSPRLAGNLTGPAPVAAPTATAASADSATLQPASATAISNEKPFFDFQVQRPARSRPGTKGVGYPAELRAAGVQGTVLTQYVVNGDGVVEEGTFKVLKVDDPRLAEAVRSQLSALTYIPALNAGVEVRQLVQQAFTFTLSDGGSSVRMVNPRSFTTVMRPGTMIRSTDSITPAALLDIDSLVAAGTVTSENAAEFRKRIATHNDSVMQRRARSQGAADRRGSATELPRAVVTRGGGAIQDQQLPTRAPTPAGTQPYFDFQVTKPVSIVAGSPGPKYPDMLRSAGIEGQVLAQFVVGTDGRAEMSTFKSLRSDNPAFTAAVKDALAVMIFTPAELNGNAVKQLVQRPFSFSLNR